MDSKDWNYQNFKPSEFDSPDEKGSGLFMEHDFMYKLQKARLFARITFIITRGYVTEQYNKLKGHSPTSSHLFGWAADIYCNDSSTRLIIVRALLDAGFTRIGIGKDFIHVDCDPLKPPCIWHYY